MNKLLHDGCGGEVWEDPSGAGYHFTGEEAKQFGAFVPCFICAKCGQEIYGDAQIELQEELR